MGVDVAQVLELVVSTTHPHEVRRLRTICVLPSVSYTPRRCDISTCRNAPEVGFPAHAPARGATFAVFLYHFNHGFNPAPARGATSLAIITEYLGFSAPARVRLTTRSSIRRRKFTPRPQVRQPSWSLFPDTSFHHRTVRPVPFHRGF